MDRYDRSIFQRNCNMTPREMFENFKPDGVKRIQCQFKNADGTPVHPPDPQTTINTTMIPVTDLQPINVERSNIQN
ncbi:unnamed protein product [Onchocerca flexuosa]|uniref:MSP domain-containing protein n=1 Tax=Onchocerca flexuosa TaxID=387005 RepID=A0A183HWY7_9BILA|nr:unnamed protein product [Onchocerca flexuosa]